VRLFELQLKVDNISQPLIDQRVQIRPALILGCHFPFRIVGASVVLFVGVFMA
jgi:hypothetical protein